MGRHATGGAPAPVTRGGRARAALGRWLERLLMALGAGAATLVVLRWSGVAWPTTWWFVGGVALLVLVASALASTVPPAEHGHDHRR